MGWQVKKKEGSWEVIDDSSKPFKLPLKERIARYWFSEEERRPISYIMAYFLVVAIAGSLMLFTIEFLRFRGEF
jgi:hypothetical protein